MRFLAVHPGPLLYTKIFLRLEPLGLELVAAAVRRAGHDVRLLDLQVASHEDYFALVDRWRPDVVAFSCNYLANVPEIVDLAKLTRARRSETFVLVGGHSASFVARDLLEHAHGAIDCVVRGEGEASIPLLLEAVEPLVRDWAEVPPALESRAVFLDNDLVEFASRHLGTLVEHDRTRNGNLVGTLKAYLEEGEQQAAARRLRIHPNTLRYRLDRVREISGAELDDPETRLNLAVALRVQGLLGL